MTTTTDRPDPAGATHRAERHDRTGRSGVPRRRLWGAGAAVGVVAVAGFAWGVHRHDEIGAVPYQDPAAAGRLTLCQDGKPVTSGSTKQLPDTIVGGQPASGALAIDGGTATLFAYQPRAGIDPVSWSGLQLTGATVYADAAAPAVEPEPNATTLAQFLTGFPALDDGWVQLRVVLGAPGVQAQTTSYAAADLHVHGTTWQVADPGTAPCPQ
jgi:hypothetical protein